MFDRLKKALGLAGDTIRKVATTTKTNLAAWKQVATDAPTRSSVVKNLNPINLISNYRVSMDKPTIGQAVNQVLSQGANKAFNPYQRIAQKPTFQKGFFGQATNMLNTTANNLITGATDIGKGSLKVGKGIKEKKAGTALEGLFKTATGAAKVASSYNPIFQGANALASVPRTPGYKDPDVVRRLSAGFVKGMSGNDELASNVPDIKTNTPLGEIDLLKGAGSMAGFVKNPLWKKINPVTGLINKAKVLNNPVVNYMVTRTVKGGFEGFLQGLGDMPDNISPKEKEKFMTENVLMGAGSELVFDKGFDLAGKGLKRVWSGAEKTKAMTQAYDYLRDAKGRFAKAVDKMNYPGLKEAEIKFVKDTKGKLELQPDGNYKLKGGTPSVEFDKNPDFFQVKPEGEMGTVYKSSRPSLNQVSDADLSKYNFLLDKSQKAKMDLQSGKIDLSAEVVLPGGKKKKTKTAVDSLDPKFFNPGASGEADQAVQKAKQDIAEAMALKKKAPAKITPEQEINGVKDKSWYDKYIKETQTWIDSKTTTPAKVKGPRPAEQIIQETTVGKPASAEPKLDTAPLKPLSEPIDQQIPKAGSPELEANNSYEKIISEGKKGIGSLKDEPKKSLKQHLDDFYTDWVERYNPVMKLTEVAEKAQKKIGAEIRPEYNPRYILRRFLGMGGIAEQRFQKELKPIIDSLDQLGVKKEDLDLYLKSRRDINLASREIKGSNANEANKYIAALEGKYGASIKEVADKLYAYQNQGLQEMAEAGFLSKKALEIIKKKNVDYVPFQRVMDEVDEFLGMPSKVAQQSVNPIKGIKGSDKQIYSPLESIVMNTFKQRAAIEKNRVAQTVVGLQQFIPDLEFKKSSKQTSDSLAVWENGKKVYYQVGKDIADSMRGMNEESMNAWAKIFTAPAALLRQGATGRNPDFMIPNVVRDQLDAAINSKYGYIPVVDYLRGLGHLIKYEGVPNPAKAIGLGGDFLVKPGDKYVEAWMNSGGSQSFSSLTGRKSVQEMFQDTKPSKNPAKILAKWLGAGLDTMGKYSETPTRLGLFAKALDKTGNPTLAAYESREGTMDFSRMGAKMKVANSVIPFLNVGVQGLDKIFRNAKDNPGQFFLKMGIYGVAPQVMTSVYNLSQFPEEYQEIPQYVKDSNFVFVTGRNEKGTVDYVSIPKGNVITLITNPVESFLSYMAGADSQTFGQFATSFLSGALPVVGDGSNLKEVAIKTIGSNLPQAVKPATEVLLNKSFWKYDSKKEEAKEIVPYYLKNKPPGEQSYKFTPALYKGIGKVLNVSPLQVQSLMEGYLAGYTKIPANIVDSIKNMSEGKEVDKNKVPLLRRFIQETYPTGKEKTTTKSTEKAPIISQARAAEEGGIIKKLFPSSPEKIKKKDEQAVKYFMDEKKASDIDAMPTQTRYQQAQKQKAGYKLVDDILDSDLTDTQKQIAMDKVGIKAEDASYYLVAKTSASERHAYIQDALEEASAKKTDKFDVLINMRKYVNDKRILSDDIIDDLVDDELLTKDEGKQLKKIKFDAQGKLKTSAGKGSGGLSKTKIKSYKKKVASAYEKYVRGTKPPALPKLDSKFFSATTRQAPQKIKAQKVKLPGVKLDKSSPKTIPIEQLFKAPTVQTANLSKARALVSGGGGGSVGGRQLKLSKSFYRR